MLSKKKVAVGMSGGVDSSVTAYLLQRDGYDVIGVNMRLGNYSDTPQVDTSCTSGRAAQDARRICDKLRIPFYEIDFRDEFEKNVVRKFLDEYESGRTPNPCIDCNKKMKFGHMIQKAAQLGAYYVATGHYANIDYDQKRCRHIIKTANSSVKDQTYALYHLRQDQLEHILLPLGKIASKDEVREIAKMIDVDISEKKDSQEICFVPNDDYTSFVLDNRPGLNKSGKFVDKYGNELGNHCGIINYTIGQRKGLGITFGKPVYVIGINPTKNEVVLGNDEDVFFKGLIGSDANFIPFEDFSGEINMYVKIRYGSKPAECKISKHGEGKIKVIFKNPQRAVTPGQAAVFYDADLLVGGVTIDESIQI